MSDFGLALDLGFLTKNRQVRDQIQRIDPGKRVLGERTHKLSEVCF